MIDFLIIGAGISGTLIARELSRYEHSVMVVDKENDIGNHATLANSAIIHSGHDPLAGSLKASLCIEGNEMYTTLAKELDIPLLETGAYVVAHDDEEVTTLKKLLSNAQRNGVKGATLLDAKEARAKDPNLSDSITKVLSLPSTKVTYPWEVAIAALENAIDNGARYQLNFEVQSIVKSANSFTVTSTDGKSFKAKSVINAAGTFADTIASMVETTPKFTITPRRGEYFVLDKKVKGFMSHVLYPVPSASGKGVLLVPQVHGNILLGPTSTHQTDKENTANHSKDLEKIKSDANRLAKNIPYKEVIRTFSGIRATSTYHDFYIQSSKEVPHFYHVAGIDSPGLTAAPAVAKYVVNQLIKQDHTLTKKTNFNPIRKSLKVFETLSFEEKLALIDLNPAYKHIVCKCERITEAEIIEHINRPCGSDTLKGIKKRARVGSGLCQGGYCEGLTLKIIAKTTNQPLTAINYYHKKSAIILKETKVKS